MCETVTSDGPSVEIKAEGNVILASGQDRIAFLRLQLNPGTGTGVFQLPQDKP